MGIARDDLPLQRVYRWELEYAGRVFLTQPSGGGRIRHWTWAQAVGEARRMAAYLKAQDWEPGSRVAILSKNCAWWILSDLAIWMAGHVSVPIYPSLRAQLDPPDSGAQRRQACFLGPTEEKEAGRISAVPPAWRGFRFPMRKAASPKIGLGRVMRTRTHSRRSRAVRR